MSNAIEALDARAERSAALSGLHENVWASGLIAAVAWAAAAVTIVSLPDVVPWGSDGLFAIIMASGALALVVLAFAVAHLGRFGEGWIHYGPWLIAIGVWLLVGLTTAKFGGCRSLLSPPMACSTSTSPKAPAFDLHRLYAAPVVNRLRLARWLARARRRARLVEAFSY
jgi:NitT/TauT family transport system permease protein